MAKTKKRVKSEMSLIFGKEPAIDMLVIPDEDYNAVLGNVLRWYTNYGGAETPLELRNLHTKWLKEYADKAGIDPASYEIPTEGIYTMGAVARLYTKGFPFIQKHIDRLNRAFTEWKPAVVAPVDREAIARRISLIAKIKNETAITPVLTIFDNAIDAVVDGAKSWNVSTKASLNGKQSGDLYSMYNADLKELNSVLNKSDPEILEYYNYPRMTLKRLVAVHEQILAEILACSAKGDTVRKERKARKAKPVPASAHVKRLQFKRTDPELNLTSINPVDVMDAQKLYVYDTRKRLLKVYTAASPTGVMVHGTTLKNVFCEQKVIRRPNEQLMPIVAGSKKQVQSVYESIRAKVKPCTGRMNKDTLILRRFP